MTDPAQVPEHCPGTESEAAGKVSACQGCPNQSICASGVTRLPDLSAEHVKSRLSSVKNTVIVLSGKGGVGKSTFTSLLARALAAKDQQTNVAVLDIDVCGPSMPRVMGVLDEQVHQSGSGWSPVFVDDNLSVMSVGFLLNSPDDAVIWRGPKKTGMIRQFLSEVDWGEVVDFLIIDTPPGTSDEHLSVVQYLQYMNNLKAIIVTTPQEVALIDVRKEIDFCRKTNIPILGVIENMTSFVCSNCQSSSFSVVGLNPKSIAKKLDEYVTIHNLSKIISASGLTSVMSRTLMTLLFIKNTYLPETYLYKSSDIFPKTTGGAEAMCAELDVPLLGKVPLDPRLAQCCDEGSNFIQDYSDSPTTIALVDIVSKIV